MRNYRRFESDIQLQFPSISRLACSIGPKQLPNAQPYPPIGVSGTSIAMDWQAVGRVGAGTGLAPIHTHSTVSFTLKDVLIGVRCGIILGEKTPPLSLMVLWLKEPSFLSSSADDAIWILIELYHFK